MKIVLHNPCSNEPRDQPFWGDFHFGRALCRCLEELGCTTLTRYWPDWTEPDRADVLLTLHGVRRLDAPAGDYGKRVLWIISHPENVTDQELEHFDLVLCGSFEHAERLSQRGFNAQGLLQCTDPAYFFPPPADQADTRNAFVFVGNRRGAHRTVVEDAVDTGLPLRIWGRGWENPSYASCLAGNYFPNERLGELYRHSYCTLNDHWTDMVEFNYVNNRVFDALACGLPVLSEPHPGLAGLRLGGIREIQARESFNDVIDAFIIDYETIRAAARSAAGIILKEHTFGARARQLLALL